MKFNWCRSRGPSVLWIKLCPCSSFDDLERTNAVNSALKCHQAICLHTSGGEGLLQGISSAGQRGNIWSCHINTCLIKPAATAPTPPGAFPTIFVAGASAGAGLRSAEAGAFQSSDLSALESAVRPRITLQHTAGNSLSVTTQGC